MATKGKKISQVPVSETLSGDELIPFAKDGANGAVTSEALKSFAQEGIDVSNIIGEPSDNTIEDIEPSVLTDMLRKTPQSLTDSEQKQVMENLGHPDIQVFNDQWNAAWGPYGKYDPVNAPDPEHPYLGNELWMTYQEAVAVDEGSRLLPAHGSSIPHCRTIYPANLETTGYGAYPPMQAKFRNNTNLEVVRFTARCFLQSTSYMFENCIKLRKVYGDIILMKAQERPFKGCEALTEITITTPANLDIKESPLLSLASFTYMVKNATNGTTPITITVHPDVYAKLTDEANAEWHKVLTDAAAKNISFATVS